MRMWQAPAPTQAPAVAAALPGTPAALAELLPRGLAALRDMGEGLAMSRQLSERSQALAADIASARASAGWCRKQWRTACCCCRCQQC